MASFRHNPANIFRIFTAVFIVLFYILYRSIWPAPLPIQHRREPFAPGSHIQLPTWPNNTGAADREKLGAVVDAMRWTFDGYRSDKTWGADGIRPVSGEKDASDRGRNGWGAMVVDAATTLASMGLWEDLELCVEHIVSVNFTRAEGGLVDPFETTIRYVGGLVSLVDLWDAGTIPTYVMNRIQRDEILARAVTLAQRLAPAYSSPTGLMWPKVEWAEGRGVEDSKGKDGSGSVIGPARAGTNILENRVLSRLTGEPVYLRNATKAWQPLVYSEPRDNLTGLIAGSLDVLTGQPVNAVSHWDSGHDSYYEYLLKASVLGSKDHYTPVYKAAWVAAANAVRRNLTTRSSIAAKHPVQHLFLGRNVNGWYVNEMSHLACFVPGNLMLGGRFVERKDLVTMGQALLETCHYLYNTTATGLGAEAVSWMPVWGYRNGIGYPNATFLPQTGRQIEELHNRGYWVTDAKYLLRPEYVESLFYAWRITGQQRYRDWAWEAFQAMQKHCKTTHGYSAIRDVEATGETNWLDETQSYWAAETLKYLYLIFADVSIGSLDYFVYTTEGHPLRMMR